VIAVLSETVTLWRPTGQKELDLVAASQWREWPPRLPEQPIFYPVLNRWYATKIARQWNVPHGGVGYVTRFDVRKDYLDRFPVQQAGGRDVLEYWIPAEELGEFNANLTGPIIEEARYLGSVRDEEFAQAANRLDCQFPAAWREYLQGQSWLSRGWLGKRLLPDAAGARRVSGPGRGVAASRAVAPWPRDPGHRRQPRNARR
jgi:hypothetical protein